MKLVPSLTQLFRHNKQIVLICINILYAIWQTSQKLPDKLAGETATEASEATEGLAFKVCLHIFNLQDPQTKYANGKPSDKHFCQPELLLTFRIPHSWLAGSRTRPVLANHVAQCRLPHLPQYFHKITLCACSVCVAYRSKGACHVGQRLRMPPEQGSNK